MKTMRRIITGIALLGSLLSVSCTKETEVSSSIKFGVSTSNSIITKTSYSGVVTSGKERIDWKSGDKVRIWSNGCTNPASHYADYKVDVVTTDDDNIRSHASVTAVSSALMWAETQTYSFFGVYPSPSTVSDNSIKMQNDTLTFWLPETQPYTVNMGLGYLGGTATVEYAGGSDTSVDLEFKPLTTTFVVNLKNLTDEDVTVKSVILSSSTDALNGMYIVYLAQDKLSAPSYGTSKSKITVTPDDPIVVAKTSGTMSVTIFAVPQTLTNVTLTVVTTSGTRSIALQDKDKSSYIFKGKWKYNMTFSLPELGIIPGTEPINPDSEETDWADIQVQGTTSTVAHDGSDIWD